MLDLVDRKNPLPLNFRALPSSVSVWAREQEFEVDAMVEGVGNSLWRCV